MSEVSDSVSVVVGACTGYGIKLTNTSTGVKSVLS